MSRTVKPSNSTDLQHALALLEIQYTEAVDTDIIRRSRKPLECDSRWLPWLAWEGSISREEGWDFAKTDEARRRLIADYIRIHQHKGTPSVIRQLFRNLGLGEITIIERAAALRWNGQAVFDGTYQFGGHNGDWAKYAIVINQAITNAEAEEIRMILDEIAPKRCELVYIDYRNTPLYWNGEINFDGQYNFGAA